MTSHDFRLFMDARYTRTDFHDGISRFGSSLIGAVAKQHDDLTMIISDPAQLKLLPEGIPWIQVSSPTSAAEPFVAYQIREHHPDVVFSPMQTMGSWGRDYGLILTLHDLIYYQHRTPPHDLPAPIRGLWRIYHMAYWPQRVLLDRADAVATVSATTQRLMRHHRLTSRPITVISNAGPQLTDPPRDPQRAPEKTLVYMGSFMEYKNVEDLVRGMQYLPDYRLHLLSKITDERRAEFTAIANQHGVNTETQLVFHNGTDEAEYQRLLREAAALVTLSKTEGFGLPLVEAMTVGTPVIASDIEIFREIGGPEEQAARFVQLEQDNPDAVARHFAAQVRSLEDPGAFSGASTAAVGQAGHFTWDNSANALLRLAARVHQQNKRRKQR